MSYEPCEKAVFNYVIEQPPGTVFALTDFSDFGTYDSIRQALCRLSKKGVLKRVVSGIYCLDGCCEEGEGLPPPNAVAEALARNYCWTILPGTEAARKALGLSFTLSPAFAYFSTGPGSTYKYDGIKLSFIHSSGRFVSSMPPDTALVVSALLDLNRHKVSAAEVYHLSQTLSAELKTSLLVNLRNIPARLRPVIEIICNEYGRAGR